MNGIFIIWTISFCLPAVLADSEEQCDIYGALVNKPGRICICDQHGIVRCKPRLGGRFLVCVMDISTMGANIQKIYDNIAQQKKIFREWVVDGEKKKEPEEKVNPNFDPPDFTMTQRPGIPGGIGESKVEFGKTEVQSFTEGNDSEYDGADGGGGEGEGGEEGESEDGDGEGEDGDGEGEDGDSKGEDGDGEGEDGEGDDTKGDGEDSGGEGGGGDKDKVADGKDGGAGGDTEKFRRLKPHPMRKPIQKYNTKPNLKRKASSNPKLRSMFHNKKRKVPKNSTLPRKTTHVRSLSTKKIFAHRKIGNKVQLRSMRSPRKSPAGKTKTRQSNKKIQLRSMRSPRKSPARKNKKQHSNKKIRLRSMRSPKKSPSGRKHS